MNSTSRSGKLSCYLIMLNDKFWSMFAMPIGVLICFGPCIVAWLLKEFKTPPEDKPPGPR